jgi:histone H3/H4
MACNTEGTAVSEITTIMRMLDRTAVGRLMRDVGTMGMGKAESALDRTAVGRLMRDVGTMGMGKAESAYVLLASR